MLPCKALCSVWVSRHFPTWPIQPLQPHPQPTAHDPAVPTTRRSPGATPSTPFTTLPAGLLFLLSRQALSWSWRSTSDVTSSKHDLSFLPLLPLVLLLLFYGSLSPLPDVSSDTDPVLKELEAKIDPVLDPVLPCGWDWLLSLHLPGLL